MELHNSTQPTQSTSWLDCRRSSEEKSELLPSVPPRMLKSLNFLHHPITMGLEYSSVGGCLMDFALRLKMNGPGCDLSSMWKWDSPAMYVPIIIVCICVPSSIAGYLVYRSEHNRLLVAADEKDTFQILTRSPSFADEIGEVADEIYISDVNSDNDQAPKSDILENALNFTHAVLKNKFTQAVEALIFGMLLDVLIWPTEADNHNCYMGNSAIGSIAVKVMLPLLMMGILVLYCIGVRIERAERQELLSDDTSELGRRNSIFYLSEEGSGIEFTGADNLRAHLRGDIIKMEGDTKIIYRDAYGPTLKGTRIFPEYTVSLHADGQYSSYVLGEDVERQLRSPRLQSSSTLISTSTSTSSLSPGSTIESSSDEESSQ